METKLPKPSGLKRPMQLTKSILPTDRIKAAPSSFGTVNKQTNSLIACATTNFTRPFTTNLQNVKRNNRAASPEMHRSVATETRAKLRRSRSACDVNEIRSLKRTDMTLAPIPAKISRPMTNSSTIGKGYSRNASASNTSSSSITTRNATTLSTAVTRAGVIGKPSAIVKKPASSSATSVSTTGAGKSINKRIPPYDFKARYNDLLEKHKALKEKYELKCEQIGSLESMPEQLEESQTSLFVTQEQLKIAKVDNDCLSRQVKSQSMKIDSITSCLVKTREELDQLKKLHERIIAEHSELTTEVMQLREKTADLTTENDGLTEELKTCKEQLFVANIERKDLHNTIMDLRGNIRVFCRVRPQLENEKDKMICGWNYIDEATVEIQNFDLIGKNKSGTHTFSFDHVFHPGSSQNEIFEMVSPLIQSALDGYNVCIFAYGQTGSGKTYTMDGISSDAGVIPRTVDLLFDSVKNYKNLGWEYEIKVTFLEIYNEVLYDLLSNEPKEMEIRMSKYNKNDIYVSNITRETVVTASRLRQLMQVAKMNRATAATVGNERSSRSHAVTKIELIGTHTEKNEISVGSINLVDLAGSESGKTTTRMNETKNINRSLSELTNVILALLQKQDHIPYRNSKLTHLLMPSLGGNSKTLMFINVAPLMDCFVESVKSLRFAASVNSCKMAKAKRNRFLNTSCNNSNSLEK